MWRHCYACDGDLAPGDGPSLLWAAGDAPRHTFHLACWQRLQQSAQAGAEQVPVMVEQTRARAA